MKKEDMIVEAAKRTLVAVYTSLKDSSPFIVPFALVGLLTVKLWMTLLVIAMMLAWEGYEHYKEVVLEEVEGIKSDSDAEPTAANNTPAEEVSTEDNNK